MTGDWILCVSQGFYCGSEVTTRTERGRQKAWPPPWKRPNQSRRRSGWSWGDRTSPRATGGTSVPTVVNCRPRVRCC